MSYSLDVLRNSWQTSFIMRKVIFQNPLLGSCPGIRRRFTERKKNADKNVSLSKAEGPVCIMKQFGIVNIQFLKEQMDGIIFHT